MSFFLFFFSSFIRGYEVECFGESSTLTTQLFVVSDSGNLVPLSAPSASLENEFLGKLSLSLFSRFSSNFVNFCYQSQMMKQK